MSGQPLHYTNQMHDVLYFTVHQAPARLQSLDVRILTHRAKQDRCTAEITSIYSVSLGEPQCKGPYTIYGLIDTVAG